LIISIYNKGGPTCFITGKSGFGFGFNRLFGNNRLQFWLEDYNKPPEKTKPQLVKLMEIEKRQLIMPTTEHLLEFYTYRIKLLGL